ncbi:hypothetical protein HQN90_37895 [Paenibacillus alba]|uniref:hypothetical protein n=1 Tax=Paenibacillus alba TaxID=1197127 RepID=UPI001563E217|nr:hypothetical protein [Paenibacillus alba]NQX71849.1 hypothetical protein [Paenibacillus alba]
MKMDFFSIPLNGLLIKNGVLILHPLHLLDVLIAGRTLKGFLLMLMKECVQNVEKKSCAPDSVSSAYMLIIEILILFTVIRLFWDHTDKYQLTDTLFIKHGPLTLRSQYSKLVPSIRALLEFAKQSGRPIHIIGQEKSGAFYDHLSTISRYAPPKERGEKLHFGVLSHDYVRREIYRTPDLSNPYGKRTNWGEKVYVKFDPNTYMVLNIPIGAYNDDVNFPRKTKLIGYERILATLPSLISHKYEGALFPIELANGIASMPSYPSAKILQRFAINSR